MPEKEHPLNENKPNIKLLSIGINEYKSDSVKDLRKCVQDVELMQAFFSHKLGVPEANLRKLTNEEATRNEIIEAFRAHFQGLEDGDIAVLHYSGHGSWEDTHPAFIDAGIDTPGSRTEVLVCHDSRIDNTYNIADKELRWLVHELQYTPDGQPTGVQFVALLDCCYSGSMFRRVDEEVVRRMHPGSKDPRPLAMFLEQQYEQMEALQLP